MVPVATTIPLALILNRFPGLLGQARPVLLFFFFNATAPPQIYTLSLHDALPIREREDRAAKDLTAYLAAVLAAMMRHDPRLAPYPSPICPECDELPPPEDGVHTVLGATVVVGIPTPTGNRSTSPV